MSDAHIHTSGAWRSEAEGSAITYAQAVARDLGHAAVIATRGRKGYERYEVFDSWKALDDGWTPALLVSSTGKVVACAETE